MRIPDSTEAYKPATAAELRNRMLEDMRLQYERLGISDPDLSVGSDAYIRSEACARADFAVYSNITLSSRNASELTAEGAALQDFIDALVLPTVVPSGGAGTVVPVIQNGATVTFYAGTEFRLPNNKAGVVSGTQTGLTNGDEVVVSMTDTGADTNAIAGSAMRWVSPPLYVEVDGTVGANGITGGTGVETPEEKRARIRNRRANVPGAGNNAHLIELAEGASTGIQKAFVYPSLGGPGSNKVALISDVSFEDPKDFSREVPAATVALALAAIQAVIPGSDTAGTVVQSVEDELCDVTLQMKLPSRDNGWTNATVWPNLVTADAGAVTITTYTDSTHVVVSAQTILEPDDGVTEIACWDETEQQFTKSVVSSYTGSSGAWSLTLSTPLTNAAVGSFVSPSSANMAAYAETFLIEMSLMGPGENTSNALLTESSLGLRVPEISQTRRGEWASELTSVQTSGLIEAHDEIADVVYSYRSKTEATAPSDINTAPNVLRLSGFGIYKKV